MSYLKVPGQSRAKSLLRAWFESDRLPHTVLIAGPDGTGKRTLAIELAKAVLCPEASVDSCDTCLSCRRCDELTHPDLHVLLPIARDKSGDSSGRESVREAALEYLREPGTTADSSTNIARENIRSVQREMIYAPTTSHRRVAILFDAERMHPVGANSLLKTLEEPPPNAVFILVSTYPERILPTILSRCQQVPVERLGDADLRSRLQDSELAPEHLERAVRMAGGSLQRAHQIAAGEFDEIQSRVEEFLAAGINGEEEVYWTVVDELGGRAARLQLERFLRGCHIYFRDLLTLQCSDAGRLTVPDRRGFLERIAPHLDIEQLETMASLVDRAFEGIHRNVNANLLLADLWRHLSRRVSRRQRQPS